MDLHWHARLLLLARDYLGLLEFLKKTSWYTHPDNNQFICNTWDSEPYINVDGLDGDVRLLFKEFVYAYMMAHTSEGYINAQLAEIKSNADAITEEFNKQHKAMSRRVSVPALTA